MEIGRCGSYIKLSVSPTTSAVVSDNFIRSLSIGRTGSKSCRCLIGVDLSGESGVYMHGAPPSSFRSHTLHYAERSSRHWRVLGDSDYVRFPAVMVLQQPPRHKNVFGILSEEPEYLASLMSMSLRRIEQKSRRGAYRGVERISSSSTGSVHELDRELLVAERQARIGWSDDSGVG